MINKEALQMYYTVQIMGIGDDSVIFPITTITVQGTSSDQAKKNAIMEV